MLGEANVYIPPRFHMVDELVVRRISTQKWRA